MLNRLAETLRVLVVLPRVELGRIVQGPSPMLSELRALAKHRARRPFPQRHELKKVIARVDALMPGGGNCYRRSLLEIALDSGAAQDRLFMGLSANGGAKSGHAWLGSASDAPSHYDAIFSL